MTNSANRRFVRVLRIAFAFSLPAIISGCSRSVGSGEVPGTYVAKYRGGSEKLILLANGRFTQEVLLEEGDRKKFTARGGWSFDARTHDVVFDDNFLIAFDGQRLKQNFESPQKGVTVLPVEHLGPRPITIGVDEGVLYRKK